MGDNNAIIQLNHDNDGIQLSKKPKACFECNFDKQSFDDQQNIRLSELSSLQKICVDTLRSFDNWKLCLVIETTSSILIGTYGVLITEYLMIIKLVMLWLSSIILPYN